jgi:hypothetical protein
VPLWTAQPDPTRTQKHRAFYPTAVAQPEGQLRTLLMQRWTKSTAPVEKCAGRRAGQLQPPGGTDSDCAKGGAPASNSYASTPTAHTSTAGV